ncbi:MAG: hypothetical protein Roseis2KO_02660 [Roseivirga sp.]
MTAKNDVDRLKQDSLELVQASIAASERVDELNRQNAYYEQKLTKAQAELKEKELMLLQASQKALNAKMKLQTIANDLQLFDSEFSSVLVEDGHVKVVMDQAILFDQGSTKINFQGDILLERLAATLKKADDVEVAVEGHTDSVPVAGSDNNWDLSVDRSIAVIEKLTNDYGVSPDKLIAAGKSKFDPIVPNEGEEAMAKNRRVEFIIIPNLEPIESEIED